MQFIGTGAKALGLSSRSKPKLAMMASLDHSMWFYSDVDSSQWHLYHVRSLPNGRIAPSAPKAFRAEPTSHS